MGKRDGFYKRDRFWWCSTDPVTGRPKSTKCTGLEAAKAWRRERELQKHDPSYFRATQATFGEWANKLTEMKSHEVRAITLRSYPQRFGHWVRLVPASTVLADIGPGTYDAFIAMRRKEGVTDYTIGKELTAMSTMLRLAKRAGCYPGDLESLRPIDFKAKCAKRTRALTFEEFGRLMYQLLAERQAFVCFAIALGCRRSEVFRLLPTDVGDKEVFIGGTKTDEAARRVPIMSIFRPLIDRARAFLPLRPTLVCNLNRELHTACDNAGIERVSPNDLRRTHASWLRERGVDGDTMRRLLGHTSTVLLDQVYDRSRPEVLAEHAERRIAETTRGHDNLAIPEPRGLNIRRKALVTKGAYGVSLDPINHGSGLNHADRLPVRTDENRRTTLTTDTRTRQSSGALARCGLIDPRARLRLGYVAAGLLGVERGTRGMVRGAL